LDRIGRGRLEVSTLIEPAVAGVSSEPVVQLALQGVLQREVNQRREGGRLGIASGIEKDS
jgi:hypothetical protein